MGDRMEGLLQVGAITNSHGLRGEVKVYPTTDDPSRFLDLKEVVADTGKQQAVLEVARVKFFKQMVFMKFKGIDDINDVLQYKGAKLYVTREHAVSLEEGEYFIADLIGLRVETQEGEVLGVIQDVMRTGANDVYVVRPDSGKELLIPAIHDCIKEIDLAGGRMEVCLLPGLREMNAGKPQQAGGQ